MASHAKALIYAELLSNIRQVSVGCQLPSTCDASTEARLSLDGSTLTVSHQETSAQLKLPGKVVGPMMLPIQPRDGKSLSWRLALARLPLMGEVQEVPWAASDLAAETLIACRSCMNRIVPEHRIKAWKDLPSENWAEMMEFWHCHKPQDSRLVDDQKLAYRGYGANSRITAQVGIGLVDLTSFLLHEEDCLDDAFLPIPTAGNDGRRIGAVKGRELEASTLTCSTCRAELGIKNQLATSVTLFKWKIQVPPFRNSNKPPPWDVDIAPPMPNLSNCVSTMLTSTLARSGCSKSFIVPTGPSQTEQTSELLHIWLFNTNITFCSTEMEGKTPVSAVKVLFRMVQKADASQMLDSLTSEVQDISLPESAVPELLAILNRSNTYLPPGERTYKQWTVGLLDKWPAGPLPE